MDIESAGTATLHRQDLQGARVEPAEEVRHLTRTCGEPLRQLRLGARAAGPLVALPTASRALVWQENEPQLRPGAAARQRPVRLPAASRPFAGSSRCRGSSWSSLQASWSRWRRDLKMTLQTFDADGGLRANLVTVGDGLLGGDGGPVTRRPYQRWRRAAWKTSVARAARVAH